MTLEETLLEVWRQTLIDNVSSLELAGRKFRILSTSRTKLRQVDFEFEGRRLRGLEQNPNTSSRWAHFAREGKQVMQFLENLRYLAVVVDGHITWYGKRSEDTETTIKEK